MVGMEKKLISASCIIIALLAFGCSNGADMYKLVDEGTKMTENQDHMFEYQNVKIEALGHAATRIKGSAIIYVDPYDIQQEYKDADIVLITHSHYDHCSPDDLSKVTKEETIVIATPDCAEKLSENTQSLGMYESTQEDGVKITAVPAYNIGKKFHPKENNWEGYIIEIDGVKIYQAGDTDRIPEMKEISCDIALLPVGGTYTMDPEEAAGAAADVKAKIAVPIHYGKIVGSEKDAQDFAKLCKCDVKVLY